VCTLVTYSQYLVKDPDIGALTSVVSGALDRLHYERDPCIKFDSERKLWVYLHRWRKAKDFDPDGIVTAGRSRAGLRRRGD